MFGKGCPNGIGACFVFRTGADIFHDLGDSLEDIAYLTDTLDRAQHAQFLVVFDDRQGMCFEDPQAVADGFLIIIPTVSEAAAARIAASLNMRRCVKDVIHLAAGQTGTATDQALNQRIDVDGNQQRQVQRAAKGGQQLVHCLGLLQVPWKTVKNKSLACIRPGHALLDSTQHNIVTDQLTGIHRCLGLAPECGSLGDCFTQHVTG